jgi:integrase
MDASITTTEPTSLPAAVIERVISNMSAALAPSTLRVYRSGLKDFAAWCEGIEAAPLPSSPELVAGYVTELAERGLSVSTIEQRLAAIRYAHEAQDIQTPTASKAVRLTMSGIRRKVGVAPKRQAAPATAERITAMLSHVQGDGIKAVRDRAVLLLGFASAMRRSELVALQVEDIERKEDGLLLTIRRSKTDQDGAGVTIAIPRGQSEGTCPVAAVEAWLAAAGIESGNVFRSITRHGAVNGSLSGRAVADIVKAAASKAGVSGDFSGHSLRSGFVTSAADRGVRAESIADHTRHASVEMVRTYTRKADLFRSHPGEGLL